MAASGYYVKAVALVLGATGLCVAAPAAAVTISIGSIVGVPGSGFTPNDRLGLGSGPVADVTFKHVINIDDCETYKAHASPKIRITWSWSDKLSSTATSAQYAIKAAPGGITCDDKSLTEKTDNALCKTEGAKNFSNFSQPTAETADVDLRHLLANNKCTDNLETTAKIHFLIEEQTPAGTTTNGQAMNVVLDLLAPKPPTIQSLTSGSTNLKVTWKHVDEANAGKTSSRVYWSTTPITPESAWTTNTHSDTITGTSFTIKDLVNGTPYYVSVAAVDENGNESDGSKVEQAAPLEVQDFWQYYQAHGGAEEGGFGACTAAPVASGNLGGLALLALAGGLTLAAARRRSRLRAGARANHLKTGSIFFVVAASALLVGAPRPAMAESPRTSSLDLRVGLYQPGIDREFTRSGVTPYGDVMKEWAFEYGFSVDWRLLHGFGELSMGFGLGTWEKEGESKAVAGGTTQDKTSLDIIPITLDVVYRFDLLAEKLDFPLVPYVKGGLAYSFWWVENGVGDISTYSGVDAAGKSVTVKARGGTGGLHGTVGLRLMLDPFEPQAARGFDIEMGVNHSYIFAEYRRLSLNDFGSSKSIDLSDDVLTFGLAFDL